MKQFRSILLLACFGLYHFGYFLVFFTSMATQNISWERKIWEEEIDHSQTESIAVPLSIPYMANQEDYQITNTSMELEGKYVRVIKQRYQNDTLHVVIVHDSQKQKTVNLISDWVKSLNKSDGSEPSGQNGAFVQLLPKHFTASPIYRLTAMQEEETVRFYSEYLTPIPAVLIEVVGPPPRIG